MNRQKIKNILTKIGQINPKYSLENQVYNFGKLIQFIPNPSEDMKLAVEIQKNPGRIREIDNPSENLVLMVLKMNPLLGKCITRVKNPSLEFQLAIVNEEGTLIEFLYEMGIQPSPLVKLAAVKNDGWAIKFIPNPSDELKIEAVKRDPDMIEFIGDQPEEAQIAVIEYDYSSHFDDEDGISEWEDGLAECIELIKNPTPRVRELARQKGFDI
ncbi:MAG: hypothetical protein EBS55_06520 [Flavobacteriaceae bacterium]|nr:hypothetical protein [Flavobacteriaceae bacterium]